MTSISWKMCSPIHHSFTSPLTLCGCHGHIKEFSYQRWLHILPFLTLSMTSSTAFQMACVCVYCVREYWQYQWVELLSAMFLWACKGRVGYPSLGELKTLTINATGIIVLVSMYVVYNFHTCPSSVGIGPTYAWLLQATQHQLSGLCVGRAPHMGHS